MLKLTCSNLMILQLQIVEEDYREGVKTDQGAKTIQEVNRDLEGTVKAFQEDKCKTIQKEQTLIKEEAGNSNKDLQAKAKAETVLDQEETEPVKVGMELVKVAQEIAEFQEKRDL